MLLLICFIQLFSTKLYIFIQAGFMDEFHFFFFFFRWRFQHWFLFFVLLLPSLVEESIKSELTDSSTTLLWLYFLSGDFWESFLSVDGSQIVNKAYLRNVCFSTSTTKVFLQFYQIFFSYSLSLQEKD